MGSFWGVLALMGIYLALAALGILLSGDFVWMTW